MQGAPRTYEDSSLVPRAELAGNILTTTSVVDCSTVGEECLSLFCNVPLNPYASESAFLTAAAQTFPKLPVKLRDAILQFHRVGNMDGALLLRSLPLDPLLPPTPTKSTTAPAKTTFVSEWVLAVIASGFGEPVGYIQEKAGALFQNVIPNPAADTVQSSESSRAELKLHTECCFHPFPPDYVCLYCLRTDHERRAYTLYASSRRILPALSRADKAYLFKRAYQTGVDYSFKVGAGRELAGPIISVLSGSITDPIIRYDEDLMIGLNVRAQRTLNRLCHAAKQVMHSVCLEAGDLLVLDNRRAAHGRTAFGARYDGYDRWLQRLNVVSDLSASEGDRRPRERIIRTDDFRRIPTGNDVIS